MEQELQKNVVRVFDDKNKIAEAPIISNEKLESQKKTAISDQIKEAEKDLTTITKVTAEDLENQKQADLEFRDIQSKEAAEKRRKELLRKNAYSQPKKNNLVDRSAFEGSKNVQTNQRQVNRTRNSNGTISVKFPKLDLRPKGNGSGKRFT